jgi:putative nucleotidyltransferase with HDIG domain
VLKTPAFCADERGVTRRVAALVAHALLLIAGLAATILTSRAADWHPGGLVVLLAVLAVASDLLAIETRGMHLTGAAIAIVLAMCFLGPGPAVAIGLATVIIAAVRTRSSLPRLLNNLGTFATYPLVGGLVARAAFDHAGNASPGVVALVVFGVYCLAILLNFVLIAGFHRLYFDTPITLQIRKILVPLLPSEAALGMLVLAFALAYKTSGLIALTVLALALFAFQALTRALLTSQERAEQLAIRSTELASLQVGVLTALVQTLSLRDKMTARHSAAVARYAKAIAEAIGCTPAEQELVHTAGLLHDIGKFIFPDRILFADRRLTDDDWAIVKKHPSQGARVVSRVSAYGPVAEIIHCHHERIDGTGYPRGLKGEEIPILSRMISIADTYDVMTARDSYRDPVSSAEAIAELRRVSGAQLDGRLVEVFIAILERRGLSFQHTTDADFERELAFETRVAGMLEPPADSDAQAA